MNINISRNILSLTGQRVNEIKLDEEGEKIVIRCSRDTRRSAIDPATGKKGTINQHIRRQVNDIPLLGYPCVLDIELAQVFISKGERRIKKNGRRQKLKQVGEKNNRRMILARD